MKWKGRHVSNKRYFDLSREKKRNDERKLSDTEWVTRAVLKRIEEMQAEGK